MNGDIPVDDEFISRLDAFDGVGEDDALPRTWTPEHVHARLVEAFKVVVWTPDTTLGMLAGERSAWPTVLREFSDLVDGDAREQARKDWVRNRITPGPLDLSKMREAFEWPLRYLRGADPMQGDALLLHTCCIARRWSIAEALRERNSVAAKLVEILRRRNAAARKIIQDRVSERIAPLRKKASKARNDALDQRASEVANELIRRAGCEHQDIPHREVMPGKVLTRHNLDVQRKLAASLICAGLRRDKTPIR